VSKQELNLVQFAAGKILPALLIDRNTRPVVIRADSAQESMALFT
jgi:hypothetical protein